MTVTLREKIAQMLIWGFDGISLSNSNPLCQSIMQHGLGGVILFKNKAYGDKQTKNINLDSNCLKSLTTTLQSLPTKNNSLPLWISIDYEGGLVERLTPSKTNDYPNTASAYLLGQKPFELARRQYKNMAETLANYGFNLNFAPNVDLYYPNSFIASKERAYSNDPNIVYEIAKIFCQELKQNKIISCLKHFPGHGSAADTHKGYADVTKTWKQQPEIYPYQKLINENSSSIMIAHVFNHQLDEHYPASLSYKTCTNLLRNNNSDNLSYNGVIFSDDLQMGALSNHFNIKQILLGAISAGIDGLVVGNNLSDKSWDITEVIDIIEQAVLEEYVFAPDRPAITKERINESYQRIKSLKSFLM